MVFLVPESGAFGTRPCSCKLRFTVGEVVRFFGQECPFSVSADEESIVVVVHDFASLGRLAKMTRTILRSVHTDAHVTVDQSFALSNLSSSASAAERVSKP
jgi:hypothetical protein